MPKGKDGGTVRFPFVTQKSICIKKCARLTTEGIQKNECRMVGAKKETIPFEP